MPVSFNSITTEHSLSKKPPDFEDPTDANSDNLYEIVIRVTDNSIIFRDYDLKIRVMNQNEPPSFTSFEGSWTPIINTLKILIMCTLRLLMPKT